MHSSSGTNSANFNGGSTKITRDPAGNFPSNSPMRIFSHSVLRSSKPSACKKPKLPFELSARGLASSGRVSLSPSVYISYSLESSANKGGDLRRGG